MNQTFQLSTVFQLFTQRSKKKITILAALLSMLMFAGCAPTYAPVAINEEVDKCEVCGMQVKDDQHATEIILKDNKVLKFDDIGDMYVWKKKSDPALIGAEYVRDFHTKEWIELSKATFVYDRSFMTPMAFGVYSFKDEASADAYIQENQMGKKLSFDELNQHPWERNMEMMKKKREKMMMEMMKNAKPSNDMMKDTESSTDMKEGM